MARRVVPVTQEAQGNPALEVVVHPPSRSPGSSPSKSTAIPADEVQVMVQSLFAEVQALASRQHNELAECMQRSQGRLTSLLETALHDRPVCVSSMPSTSECDSALPRLDNALCVPSKSIDSAVKYASQKHSSWYKKQHTECLVEDERTSLEAQWTKLKHFTASRTFEWVSGVLIILNACMLGLETQWKADRVWNAKLSGLPPESSDTTLAVALGWLFSLFFLTELVLRWVADGFIDFFRSKDCGWNILDIVIVAFSLMDHVLLLAKMETDADVTVLRVLRVIRLVRVAKIIRVMRFFRELRIMVFSILGSFKALLWVSLIFFLIFYVSGITITTGVVTYLANNPHATVDNPNTLGIYEHFGTLDRAMTSLYKVMSGGSDWGPYFTELGVLPPAYRTFFVVYVTFAVFAVVNIVTGVFVDAALQSNQRDVEVIVDEELEQKRDCLCELAKVFEEMDRDKTGRISEREFSKCLANERVIAYFSTLKLDVSNAETLFQLLDYDRSGEIEVGEFLSGCQKLQGTSTALDAAVMQYELRYLKEMVLRLLDISQEAVRDQPSVKVGWQPSPGPMHADQRKLNEAECSVDIGEAKLSFAEVQCQTDTAADALQAPLNFQDTDPAQRNTLVRGVTSQVCAMLNHGPGVLPPLAGLLSSFPPPDLV